MVQIVHADRSGFLMQAFLLKRDTIEDNQSLEMPKT